MTILTRRIAIAALLLCLVVIVGYVATGDSSTAVAIRQWFTGIIRAVYEPIANWLSRFARRSASRQVSRGVWRIITGIFIGVLVRWTSERFIYPKLYWIEMQRYRAVQLIVRPLKAVWNTQLPIPRWARALIGIAIAGLTLWGCLVVSEMYGKTWTGWFWSIIFAVIVFTIVEKLPLIGFDAFLTIMSEHWRWFRELRARSPRIDRTVRFLSLGWLVRWIIGRLSRTSAAH